MTLNGVTQPFDKHDGVPARRGCSAAAAAVAGLLLCCGLQGCAESSDESPQPSAPSVVSEAPSQLAPVDPHVSSKDMPQWLDLYREKSLVNISSVDHVVIITFESLAERNEVYDYYAGKFGDEESFSSFRDNRDIISFIREGYGVKITLIDSTKNLWTLEYHHQAI